MQLGICAHLSLDELARLALVSKLWASAFKAWLSAEQEWLKAVAAETPLVTSNGALQQSVLALLPSRLPPTPYPPNPGQGRWVPLPDYLKLSTLSDTWRHEGSSRIFFIQCHACSNGPSRRNDDFSVGALVFKQDEMPELLGLLLVLIQDRLPRLLEEGSLLRRTPSRLPRLEVECILHFGSSLSMWAPLAPLLSQLQFFNIFADVSPSECTDDSTG